jgi:hypothetical protein
MPAIYKRTIYWVNTKDACGAVAVDQDGMVYELDTAPIYRWAARKKMTFQTFRKILLKKGVLLNVKKIGVDIDPF